MTTTVISDERYRTDTYAASSAAAWDEHVRQGGGHLLQTWRWGEFKRRYGWDTERVMASGAEGAALAQVLFKQVGPFSIGYIPRGPVLPAGDVARARELFQAIDRLSRARRALYVIVEPDVHLPFGGTFRQEGFVRGSGHVQPARTVKVPLDSDDELLVRMHTKTRYNIRLAQRRGVRVERHQATPEPIAHFYEMMLDTSRRNKFGIHDLAYYGDFMHMLGDDALLLLAYVEDQPAAGLISARFGTEAIYMYGASSTAHRAHGAAFLLQFEAMRWARDAGCRHYDLWGIPLTDPTTTSTDGDRIARTQGGDWRGLYRFKTGFGGEVVTYPVPLERRYRPVLSFVGRRLHDGYG